jgi:hypothetical protein
MIHNNEKKFATVTSDGWVRMDEDGNSLEPESKITVVLCGIKYVQTHLKARAWLGKAARSKLGCLVVEATGVFHVYTKENCGYLTAVVVERWQHCI